ncbi:MAG: hypothetical protein AVDCRST_MAG91-2849 [uncultured Sphingomonadaceae bacterium]|uniref:Uncharacterized protein n=1 Tax=uncultured Sphingomonadaceae bacterium TaxID=169976 RepID=A0A6J4TSG6_9SPHN|nr:MAG: hypothetical protein AVDCRST_MAG91-2849 [uncultured Sphingomonadaceae bacterium]
MTTDDADRLARTRFFTLSAARFAGVGLVFLGMAIWLGDLLRPGGWPAVGVPLFLLGAAATLFLPRLLARRWRSPDVR